MLEILNIARAISDENRVRTLMMLTNGELCVCQIIELLGLAPSTVSKHMWILRQAKLVQFHLNEQWTRDPWVFHHCLHKAVLNLYLKNEAYSCIMAMDTEFLIRRFARFRRLG